MNTFATYVIVGQVFTLSLLCLCEPEGARGKYTMAECVIGTVTLTVAWPLLLALMLKQLVNGYRR